MRPSNYTSLERAERRVVKKNTVVKDKDALMKFLFGDKSISVEDCIETKVKVTKSKKESIKVANKANEEFLEVDGLKKCTCCGETKKIEEYYTHETTPDNYRHFCIPCYKEDVKDRYNKNKEQDVK